MSISITGSRGGFFSKLLWAFKPKDPFVRNIEESIVLMDRMIRSIEASKRSLEITLEEHKRKLKLSGVQDKELQEIIDEENRNIMGYLNLFTKVYYDLTRVRLRLETITQVQEPMKVLPEVLEELKRIEPEVEKINPQLVSLIRMIEQKVGSIKVSTDSSSIPQPLINKYMSQKNEEKTPVKPVENIEALVPPATVDERARAAVKIPPPSPSNNGQQASKPVEVEPEFQRGSIESRKEVPLNIVEQWVLAELRSKAGILDIQYFTSKYRVSRDTVYEVLRRLEEKGLVRLKRF
ncbi:hypothetical protein DKAM_0180 [Desulfurococcus amylolyticus 1221n]|uniref:Uncharacterized protein n=1 Tax=Desulfurococcus amylolyticus (strain DSM 18924 / JCM 16383 / VKM B-2413 / 1221n) TaxID=490899 RepID=B8D2W1_DESA1|nr:hypothetical protein [Desulfurococcus amylolyticus]ACL10508.1 hypothetical protein DKAM_0180 [Desulfurococcus amylolyticus 1221n]